MMVHGHPHYDDRFSRAQTIIGNVNAFYQALHLKDAVVLRMDTYTKFKPDGKWYYCDRADPQVWFAQSFLDLGRVNKRQADYQWRQALARGEITVDEPEWSFFGPWHVVDDKITLRAVNGTWIWVLNGDTKIEDERTYCMGVWPD